MNLIEDPITGEQDKTNAIHGFWMGTFIFFAVALVISFFLPFYVASATKDKTQVSGNKW